VEAVPATSGVRRTVRVAAALVAGQVLLVAVIGWVTLTCADDRPAHDASPVDQMAAPPGLIRPIPPSSASSSPTASPVRHKPAHTADPGRTTRPASRAANPGTGETAPAPVPPPVVASPSASPAASFGPSTSSGPLTLVPTPTVTPSPTASATREPVRVGQPCSKIFALARSEDGWIVRCLPTRYRHLRWKIV
jgi:hypothetical protein